MFNIGDIITDKYNHFYKVVEKIEKRAENDEDYTLHNLYPINETPKQANKSETARGFVFKPYLDITSDMLTKINAQKIDGIFKKFYSINGKNKEIAFYKTDLEALQETQKRNKSDKRANWKAYTECGEAVYTVAVIR
jgi:hypothetical protein